MKTPEVNLAEIKAAIEAAVPEAGIELINNPGPAAEHSLLLTPAKALDVARFLRDDPELALRKAISGVVARICNREERYEPLLPDPVSLSPENRKRIRTLGRRYEQLFAGIVRSGIDQNIFVPGDPKLMTFVILRAAFTVANWYREGGKWKPSWIVEQVTEQLLRSVRQSDARP